MTNKNEKAKEVLEELEAYLQAFMKAGLQNSIKTLGTQKRVEHGLKQTVPTQ